VAHSSSANATEASALIADSLFAKSPETGFETIKQFT